MMSTLLLLCSLAMGATLSPGVQRVLDEASAEGLPASLFVDLAQQGAAKRVPEERIVPLGSFATKAITDYLVRIRPMLAAKSSKTNTALFLNSRGARLTRQSAWNMVIRAAKDAGIEAHVSPHVFRHSYATHLLDGGADIRVVQELLGHASVTTTQIYTLITIDKVRESYSLAHPRARG